MLRVLTAVGALAALLAVAAPPASAQSDPAIFVTRCDFSHRGPDDPIVAPGQPGGSHEHDFLGNVSTNAFSTYESLRAAGTRCRRDADTAAYWVPTLYSGGQPVMPAHAQIYYFAGTRREDVRAHPAGLRIVAGDARATGPQDPRVASWHCGSGSGVNNQGTVPTCPAPHRLRMRIRFPNCWDGVNLDSSDHKSHMAYSTRGQCPATHPVAVPRVALNVVYPISGGPDVTLASGGSHTAHGDFFNAWDQAELERLVRLCINDTSGPDRSGCQRQAAQPTGRRPTLSATRRRVPYGAEVALSGAAVGPVDTPVRLDVAQRNRWSPLAHVRTGGGGSFTHVFEPRRTASYRAVDSLGMVSDPVAISVTPRIAVALRRRGSRLVLRTRVVPRKRRLLLRVERRARGAWRTVGVRSLAVRGGRAATVVRLRRPGLHRLVVRSRADRSHAAGASRPLSLRVR